ncbi:MAG: hypothetical protein ACKODX_14540 [Gemmata sp.]
MPRLTLRTLLAYIDDTLGPAETRSLGRKVAESGDALDLVERIKKVTRRRGLRTPVPAHADDDTADPNTVAEYLDNTLDSETLRQVEETCLGSDVHLAEVAACHQILTLVLTEPVLVPPRSHRRMYDLQKPPASEPGRRPNKSLPVSAARPPLVDDAERDAADAALLLGMTRYSAASGWAGRLALLGIGVVMLVFLAAAVFMSFPHEQPGAPETSAGNSFVLLTPPAEPTPLPKEPESTKPKVVDQPVPKKSDNSGTVLTPAAIALHVAAATRRDPGPALDDPVRRPDGKVLKIGSLETSRTLVVAQDKPGSWQRLRLKGDDDEIVMSNTPLMALPGYKAQVLVGEAKQVQVHLWGNVPEQLPYRVFESRVTFHPPEAGFDADITLLGGRIYLKAKRPTGAKVRVRVSTEVWDVSLPNEQADVLVELISWFEPGVPYTRSGGALPKAEARVAVVAGTAGIAAPRRFKSVPAVALEHQLTWDSVTASLVGPKPVENVQEVTPTPLLEGKSQQAVARVLTDAAHKVTERNVVRQVMEARLEPAPGTPDLALVTRLAIYSQAALADPTPTGAEPLKPLVDVLKSELPWPARQSVVTALTNWVARDRVNTALLRAVLINKGLGEEKAEEDAADRVLRLLRGFVSPTRPDPDRLDELAVLLADPAIPVREAALWNVVAVELQTWVPLWGGINVGAVGAAVNSDEYRKFVASWTMRIEALKKREPTPLPRPVKENG